MIQEIAPHHYNNTYDPNRRPTPDSYVFYCDCAKSSILIRRNDDTADTFDFPRFRELEPYNPEIYQNVTYLFRMDQQDFYLVETLQVPDAPHFFMEHVQAFRGSRPRYLSFAAITGHQLAQWYQSRRFCGRCGARLRKHEKERMMYCDACGMMEYPKISPAVIIGVTHGDRLLLSKYARGSYKRYALLAGFTEIGETLEETVRREVMEEVGLKVTNIRYYKSQPWSYSGSILSGFFCDLAEDEDIRLDQEELALAEWFERKDIPIEDEGRFSLTQDMICQFKEGKV